MKKDQGAELAAGGNDTTVVPTPQLSHVDALVAFARWALDGYITDEDHIGDLDGYELEQKALELGLLCECGGGYAAALWLERSQGAAEPNWQPMESAPRDGTRIIARFGLSGDDEMLRVLRWRTVAYQKEVRQDFVSRSGLVPSHIPTSWIPYNPPLVGNASVTTAKHEGEQ